MALNLSKKVAWKISNPKCIAVTILQAHLYLIFIGKKIIIMFPDLLGERLAPPPPSLFRSLKCVGGGADMQIVTDARILSV